jgi:hypothetical protein
MAILKQPTGGGGRRIKLEGPPSKGTYLAVCFEIEERFGVTRKKFESEEKEVVDLISFYFGFKQKDGTPGIVRSKPMKISGHKESNLVQFIRQWLGDAPSKGFDTDTLKGAGAQITVALQMAGNGKTYANISSIGPVMEGLEKSVPDADRFMQYLEPLGGSPAKDDDDSIPL